MARGRPRTNDPDKVLEVVMKTFWENGYEGTSLADLVAASGMAKPGLYANFGDKESLYIKALDRYAAKISNPMLERFSQPDQPLSEALSGFLKTIALNAVSEETAPGCMIALSISVLSRLPEAVQASALVHNAARTLAFQDRFTRAKHANDLDLDASIEDLVLFFSAQALAVSALARAGQDPETIQRVIALSLNALPKGATPH